MLFTSISSELINISLGLSSHSSNLLSNSSFFKIIKDNLVGQNLGYFVRGGSNKQVLVTHLLHKQNILLKLVQNDQNILFQIPHKNVGFHSGF